MAKKGKFIDDGQRVLTAEESKAWLAEQGITQTQVARSVGCHPSTIRDLLSGKVEGVRGKSHLAAIALRLKAKPNTVTVLDEVKALQAADTRPHLDHGERPNRRRTDSQEVGHEAVAA